jgi:pyridoxamine 5'-phosphate oxidase
MTSNIAEYDQPFIWFNNWLEQAKKHPLIKEPTAMALATVADNKPSLRMVLLKKFDQNGFCFFTNLTSRKGKELANNPDVALCFYWHELGYQIRIEGKIEKVSLKEADDYFSSRRRGSQIGAWASKQSQAIEKPGDFEKRLEQIGADFLGQEVPRPPFWSGFRVVPQSIEFWQEGEFRIHKRNLFKKIPDQEKWAVFELYP